MTVHVSSYDEGAAAESFGIVATYEKKRPWQEKWNEVEATYQALREVYSGRVPSGGAEEWKAIAESFFRACHELPDAIVGDSGVSATTKGNVRRAADRRAALRLVADIDNTRKHGGRNPNKCHAHVGEISWGDHVTPTMTILRECPNRPVERFDVLASATAAIDEWRHIFSRHGLVP
jgi:hypothetical protein